MLELFCKLETWFCKLSTFCSKALINLETALEYYIDLEKKKLIKKNNGIKSRKDILALKFDKLNPNFLPQSTLQQDPTSVIIPSEFQGPFICPITGIICNGTLRFDALVPCGHLASHKALLQLFPSISSNNNTNGNYIDLKKSEENQTMAFLFECPICGSKVTKLTEILPSVDRKNNLESNNNEDQHLDHHERGQNSKKKRPPPIDYSVR